MPRNESTNPTVPQEETELERLRKENAQLRTQLNAARSGKPADRQEFVPDWIPAGTQHDLDTTGKAVNPFNGARLGDWSDVDADPTVTAARPAIGEETQRV